MSIVERFEAELQKHSSPKFGQWYAVDLHNHSPASSDFQGNRDTAIEDAIAHLRATSVSLVMFADHGRLPDPDFTDQVAARSGKVVLRGAELNVFVDAWQKPANKVEKTAFFHLLIGFDPDASESADYWFTDLERRCRRETRIIGGKEIAGFVDPIDNICDTLEESGAIVIPAHLHTKHDAFKSRSVDDIYADPEFLRVARERFTALEVTDPATADYFDGEHEETKRLKKTCIQSSDAHEIGHIGRRVTYAQMETPSFAELKAALSIPFRVSLSEPEEPDSYIIGINIQGQFFPDAWLRLSPYCNALIGVKGSGKTSILECLRFALGSTVPESRKEDVSRHLASTLGPAGVVRVLIRRSDGAKLLVKRSINNEATFEITFEDDTQETVSNPDALMFPSYILGWHEIEQVATDPKIRQVYLDTIAGREQIRQLRERAEAGASQIRYLHEQVANKYAQFRSLHGQVTRLEDLRSGLQQLTDSKLVSLRDEYEVAIGQREAINGLTRTLQAAAEGVGDRAEAFLALDDVEVLGGESPLSRFALVASTAIGGLRRHIADFAEEHRSRVCAVVKELKGQSPHLELAFEEFAMRYAESVAVLSPEQQRLLESHRRVLEDTRALPELRLKQQQAKNEVMTLLTTLIETSNQVAVSLEEQTSLRTRKVEEIAEKLVHYGVMLRVSALSQRRAIDELAQKNATGADIFNQISSFNPDEKRYHRRLAQAYRNLKNDLIDGYTLFLDAPEFLDYLSVYEEDDLEIRFDVGKSGEKHSLIDELSAGQRCTAVFPLLLMLQEGPLIMDQPEDNLDNRHIAESVAPSLLRDKSTRQIAFTSHNANLVVLADAEQIVVFEGSGSTGVVDARGFLCTSQSAITPKVIAILDGGETALQLRYQKYGVSWR